MQSHVSRDRHTRCRARWTPIGPSSACSTAPLVSPNTRPSVHEPYPRLSAWMAWKDPHGLVLYYSKMVLKCKKAVSCSDRCRVHFNLHAFNSLSYPRNRDDNSRGKITSGASAVDGMVRPDACCSCGCGCVAVRPCYGHARNAGQPHATRWRQSYETCRRATSGPDNLHGAIPLLRHDNIDTIR